MSASTSYQRYDSSLVCLFALGKETLVPVHLRQRVPHSTATAWRKLDMTTFVGHELRILHKEALDFHTLTTRYQNLRRTVLVLAKVWIQVADIVLPVLKQRKEHGEKFVNGVQLLCTTMPRRRALRLVGLSTSAFHDKIAQIKFKCGISPLQRCFIRNPQQLALHEVEQIKALYDDPDLVCWPGMSLYFEGCRRRGLHIAKSTFYKYVRLLGLKRQRPKPQRKAIGLRASKPNEYLHVDTTFWSIDQGKAAIVLVSDNFSKVILGAHVALTKHAMHVVQALRNAIATIQVHHPDDITAILVSDGGSENHNTMVDELIASVPQPLIEKIIALQDIEFSNSPIEAINKILKVYLRHYKPATLSAVQRVVDLFNHDYSAIRPHGSLGGLTPMERYLDPKRTLEFTKQNKDARANRIQQNMVINCVICPR